jgi:hypothetical protein
MTSEEPNRFLTRYVAQPVFRGRSGVNEFVQRFAELRSFAAKIFKPEKATVNECSHTHE